MERSGTLQAVLRVGRRGEIYTTVEIRSALGLREGGLVRAYVVGGRLIIEPIESLEDRIRRSLVALSPREAEELSEEAQKEAGLVG